MKTGGTVRDNLEVAAERGNQTAIKALTGPDFPLALDYVWQWHIQLTRGVGEGMNGAAALTWMVFDAWARWTHAQPYPNEVFALFDLDFIARNPGSLKKEMP
jgi:hypothetical protein